MVYVQNNKTTKVKTHRVAISRYLKELEATGWIEIEKHPSRPGQPLAVNLLVQPGDLVSVTGSVTRAVTELFAKPNLEEYLLNLWRGVTVLSEKDIGKNAEKKVLDDKFYLLNIPDQDTTGKIIEKISKVPNVTPNVTPLNNETNSSNISFSRVTVTLPQNSPDSNTLLATSNKTPAFQENGNNSNASADKTEGSSMIFALSLGSPTSAEAGPGPATVNPINFEDLRHALAVHGLLLGHDFEFAPEPYRAELRGMARAGIIFEPKAGHWRYISSKPSGECEF